MYTMTALRGLTAGALISYALATGASAEVVKMATRSEVWDIVLEESGVAEKYGIEIEAVPMKSGPEVTEALVSNSVNIGSVGETPLTSLLAKTDLVTVIGTAVSTDGGYVKLVVPKESPIQSLEDLKGKTIATQIGSGSYRAMADWCVKNGCSISDFNLLNTSPAAMLAAIQSSSVDAGVWFAPTTSIAIANGFGRIVMDFKGANEGQASWVVNNQFAKENPETVAKFLAATIEAQNILVKDADHAAELLERGMKRRGRDLSADIMRMGLEDFDYSPSMDLEKKLRVFDGVWQSLVDTGKVRGDAPDFSTAIDPSYHEKAEALVAAQGS